MNIIVNTSLSSHRRNRHSIKLGIHFTFSEVLITEIELSIDFPMA